MGKSNKILGGCAHYHSIFGCVLSTNQSRRPSRIYRCPTCRVSNARRWPSQSGL